MSAGISIREFARRDGCSDKVVRRALIAGRLKALADKSLDPSLVGTGWRKTNRKAADTAPESAPDADSDADTQRRLGLGLLDLASADRVKANALAWKHQLAAREAAGELVEMETAEAVLFEHARAARDAWSNWPTRVGPMIAADLGLQTEKVVEILTAHVHDQLVELGEPVGAFSADFTA